MKDTKQRTERNDIPEAFTEALDAWLKTSYRKPEEILGPEGLLKQITKQLMERVLEAEMTHHLGYERYEASGRNTGNSRNGKEAKTVKLENDELTISIPRDRRSTFEPQLIQKHQRRLGKFDDMIISLYSRGLTQEQIKEHIYELYGIETSKELISSITDVVTEEVKSWQQRRLESVYPIAYLDALRVKGRHNGQVMTRVIYVVIGVNMSGNKEVLGFWSCESEGAKFWVQVLNELKNRGVEDILIACVDGLKGFPEAIAAVFPQTEVQLCIVHLIRSSIKQVSYKDMKAVAVDLKPIYTAATADAAELKLAEFDERWGSKYPMVAQAWRNVWVNVIPFFKFPPEIRTAIYTTNAIESINSTSRHITGNRTLFPHDEAIFKLLYLALTNAAKKWTMPIKNWPIALQQFAIFFAGRVPIPGHKR
jgi:putative transposase